MTAGKTRVTALGHRRSRAPATADPAVSARMSRVRQMDTKPEVALRRALHASGLRYRVQIPVLNKPRRTADIVFTRRRVAIFVDGCFWHGCPIHGTQPKTNGAFWREKIEANIERDADTTRRLEALGWLVVRIWEHEPVERALAAVELALSEREKIGYSNVR